MASELGGSVDAASRTFALSAKPSDPLEVARQRALQAADYYHRTVLSGLPDDDGLTGGADGPRAGGGGRSAAAAAVASDACYRQKLRAGFIELRNSYNEKTKCRGELRGRAADLHRSNSSLQLDGEGGGAGGEGGAGGAGGEGPGRRDYGSASSLDAMATAGDDSFFTMLSEYRAAGSSGDQRAPGPPQMQQLLRGGGGGGGGGQPAGELNGSAVFSEDDDGGGGGAGKGGKKERKGRAAGGGGGSAAKAAETGGGGILKRIRGATKSEGCEEARRKALAHYDCQSVAVCLAAVARRRRADGGGAGGAADTRNTTTGASAASAELTDGDAGSGRGNHLLLTCPFFRTETGGEGERLVCLTRATAQRRVQQLLGDPAPPPSLRPARCNGVAVLDVSPPPLGDATPAVVSHRGLVVEHVDHGATYYRNFFHGLGESLARSPRSHATLTDIYIIITSRQV